MPKPVRSLRRRPPSERREEILQAAIADLAERPVERITLGTVADRAGVSRALVTHYFRTRDALVGAALEAVTEQAPDVLETDPSLGPRRSPTATCRRGWTWWRPTRGRR